MESREVHVSCYPRQINTCMWWGIATNLLEWPLKVFYTYDVSFIRVIKGTNLQGLTTHYMYCMLISIQRISHSVSKVYSQGKKLKLELRQKRKPWQKKETGIIHRLLYLFNISTQLIIHQFKNFTDVKKFSSGHLLAFLM